ncbi:hypothetical protein F2P81_008516 [Scophthalmus maximus]|uniref:Diacylglycerol kinase n=1 Tax=Scophthalmus maximus TaxID=52904 RepID=A0A6A4TBI0_SCOMX|nr:hypothetical protein F2P81_008516 [Scophthalmus maximus]
MADRSGRARAAEAADSRSSSPPAVRRRGGPGPGPRAEGHCFRRVTLTKPTFCHSCSDFVWGLVGFVCEVCNFMCHEKCLKTLRSVCSCETPSAVRVPVAHCFGPAGQKKRFCCVCRKQTEGHTALRCEDHCDDVDPSAAASKDNPTTTMESGKQFLKVFDGDDAVKRGFFRLVSVYRATNNEELVEAALRAFYLPDDLQGFELHEVGGLQRLRGDDDVLNRNGGLDNRRDGGDAWLLRAKPRDAEVMKVYAGWPRSGAAFVRVSASKVDTAASVLTEVIRQLDRQEEDVSNFSLQEVYMSSKQVQRQTLTPQEKIVDKLHEIRKLSLRQMNQTRFYVVENRKWTVQVDLLIGGLPPLLTREEYVQLIQEQLTTKSHLVSISHMYPSQGAVALQVTCFSEAERIYMLAKDTSVNNKTLTSLVIPEIKHHSLRDLCPLLVFVNPKSGGLKGRDLLYSFRKLLNPHQVFDISNGGPLAGLHTFREVPRFRVLVCGGDGTVGWVLGVLEAVRHKLVCREPPIGIVPLGTGNDLARILRWGPGYGGEDPYHILVSVDEADEVLMDRWTILLDAQDVSEDGKDSGFLEPPKIVQMNNYFGLGIDAELSLDFHLAREDEPDKFTSRFHNKGVYVKVGLQKISYTRSLHKELQLQVDTHNVPLPNIEGLIFLNIPSWGSGADLWGSEVDGRHGKPRIDDGLLEVVGVTGVVHMGQVQSGLRSGIRIAQGNYIRLTLSKPIPVQVDGEPWIQPPGHIIISAAGPKQRAGGAGVDCDSVRYLSADGNVANGAKVRPAQLEKDVWLRSHHRMFQFHLVPFGLVLTKANKCAKTNLNSKYGDYR